jgi:hypothetical protein
VAEPKPEESKPGEPRAAGAASEPGADPSMEEILASIRRILSEEETQSPTPVPPPTPGAGVLVLDPSMLVAEEPHVDKQAKPATPDAPPPAAATPAPPPPPAPRAPEPTSGLVAPEAAAAAAQSVGTLVRQLGAERGTQVSRGGPTIEDIVREEVRPLLKQWLDAHLPPVVERLVRAEIERVVSRAVD